MRQILRRSSLLLPLPASSHLSFLLLDLCPDDEKECKHGIVLKRDPTNDCEFPSCPCPKNCLLWYDGCNKCVCPMGPCTLIACQEGGNIIHSFCLFSFFLLWSCTHKKTTKQNTKPLAPRSVHIAWTEWNGMKRSKNASMSQTMKNVQAHFVMNGLMDVILALVKMGF